MVVDLLKTVTIAIRELQKVIWRVVLVSQLLQKVCACLADCDAVSQNSVRSCCCVRGLASAAAGDLAVYLKPNDAVFDECAADYVTLKLGNCSRQRDMHLVTCRYAFRANRHYSGQ
jgi:hypothetical protein